MQLLLGMAYRNQLLGGVKVLSAGDGYATQIGPFPDVMGSYSRLLAPFTIKSRFIKGVIQDTLEP
jgi:hypothetical protein